MTRMVLFSDGPIGTLVIAKSPTKVSGAQKSFLSGSLGFWLTAIIVLELIWSMGKLYDTVELLQWWME